MNALYKGFLLQLIFIINSFISYNRLCLGLDNLYEQDDVSFTGLSLYYCGVIGLIVTGLLFGYRILYWYKL